MFVNKLIILPSLSVEKELHSSDSTVQKCEEILQICRSGITPLANVR